MVVAVKSPVTAYAEAVCGGEIVVGKWVRLACGRHLNDLAIGHSRGLRFDEEAAAYAIEFFGFLPHIKGEWAGRPFKLGPWETFIIGSLFGWKRLYGRCPQCDSWLPMEASVINCIACFVPGEEEEQVPAETGWYRRFRTSYLEVARKNGKSTLAAGVGLLLAFFDNEAGAEVYSAATKRDQAKIIWGTAKQMVRKSAYLQSQISVYMANMSDPESASKYEPLASEADSTDGLNSHGNLIDELHAHKTRDLLDVLVTGTGSRRQPLTFIVTTAGYDRTSICWEQHEYGTQVLEDVVQDDSYFIYIAAIDEGDDWRDPVCWLKANPNLGVSIKMDYLTTQRDQAVSSPAKQNTFKRLHCDLWTQQVDRWIDIDVWDSNHGIIDEEELKGRTCYGMLDLATVSDMTAWVMAFPGEGDQVDILARFFCPRSKVNDPGNRFKDSYQVWEHKGFLTVTEGDATDYAFVKAQILADVQKFQMVDMNVDRLFQAHQLAQELMEEGIVVIGFGMGYMSMAAPMKELERRLLLKQINHGGNPIMRWMADNVAVKQDPAGNLKPDKSESQGKIDGIIGIVGALDRVMRNDEPVAGVTFA